MRDAAEGFQCEALLADIDRDGVPDILLRWNNYDIAVFHQAPGGKWALLGRFGTVSCDTGTAGNFGSGTIRLRIETPCSAPPQPVAP